ncbi:hypothetical protein Aspvir_007082 [Aspergillus viridinutans]|uniref:Uncharacterized protein n=1 Tax=Aspergillus viridinutans TaxID=75553 RepID=A0A9P3C0B6_ASPVI|nr:uncharacterized protein Aspvir_007082 [Aspergillus viridinutans]GIK03016.1 hypothetical protein Aspvir_007082 [Aspergillus viridinutans]
MATVDGAADAASASSPASLHPNIPQAPVEARSLSAITTIASNPPAYPRNPTQKKLDPLVLYLVRVPGSKDVFLSPLKPPTKSSISAEAINASLYYLHVATPEDEILLQKVEEEREQQAKLHKEQCSDGAPPEFARLNNVRRKPVPGGPLPQRPLQQENYSPNIATVDSPPPPTPPRPTLRQGFPSSMSATAASDTYDQHPGDSRGDTGETRAPPLPRRPLSFVPTEEAPSDPINNSPAKKSHRWSALSGYLNSKGLDSWKEKYEALSAGRLSLDTSRPELRPHTSDGAGSNARRASPSRSPGQSPHRGPRDRGQAADRQGFHITLIRRDPTHGSQWNVATISTSKTDSTAVDIEVSTPGYNRFLAQDEPFSLQSLGINLPSDAQSLLSSTFKLPTQSHPETRSLDPSLPRKFRRQLCVSRPHHHRDDSRGSLDMPPNRASLDTFTGSPSRPHPQAHSKLKSGYYTFTSPWNGICTFSTSVNGRSLKCKHMIPTPSHPGNGTNPSTPSAPAVTVAEIRFNTPFQAGHHHHHPSNSAHISPFTLSQTSSDTPGYSSSPSQTSHPNGHAHPTSKRNSLAHLLNPTTYTRPRSHSSTSASSVSGVPGHGHAHAHKQRQRHTRHPSSSSTSSGGGGGGADDPDRLDFSLAREPAGGGLRGKSAKLGKLIVEDEGIKMLDLVVAACMAVWWRGYYH